MSKELKEQRIATKNAISNWTTLIKSGIESVSGNHPTKENISNVLSSLMNEADIAKQAAIELKVLSEELVDEMSKVRKLKGDSDGED